MNMNIFKKIFDSNKIDYTLGLYEYLKDDAKKKAVILITKQQYIMASCDERDFEHKELYGTLLNNIIDFKNDSAYINDIITIFVGPNDFIVDLPSSGEISKKQNDTLEELTYYVAAANRDFLNGNNDREHEIKIFHKDNIDLKYDYHENDIKEIFSQLDNYIVEPKRLLNENIIGRDLLTPYERASFMVEQMANSAIDNSSNNNSKIKGYSSFSLLMVFMVLSGLIIIIGGFMIMN